MSEHRAVIIRDVVPNQPGKYVLIDAVTLKTIGGPFRSIPEALAAARGITRTVLRENLDARGRPIGPPTPIPFPGDAGADR